MYYCVIKFVCKLCSNALFSQILHRAWGQSRYSGSIESTESQKDFRQSQFLSRHLWHFAYNRFVLSIASVFLRRQGSLRHRNLLAYPMAEIEHPKRGETQQPPTGLCPHFPNQWQTICYYCYRWHCCVGNLGDRAGKGPHLSLGTSGRSKGSGECPKIQAEDWNADVCLSLCFWLERSLVVCSQSNQSASKHKECSLT